MSRTRIGYNIGTWFINQNELETMYQYMERANPVTTLFMEGFGEALTGYERQKNANPNTEPIIIYRDFATVGKDQWRDLNPQLVLDRIRHIHGNHKHIWVYLLNEPHANGQKEVQELSDLLADSIELLCSNGYKVVAGNFSAGTIDHPEWMESFIKSVAKWKNQVLLSEHMYAMVCPNNFGWGYVNYVQSNGKVQMYGLGVEGALDYMLPQYWLSKDQINTIFNTRFDELPSYHYGRIKQIYHYAEDQMGLELPDYVATECFLDDLQDLEIINGIPRQFEWQGNYLTLKQHIMNRWGSQYGLIKGDLTYHNVYEDVYGLRFYQALFMILAHIDRTFPSRCIGTTAFTYSNAKDWNDYGHNYASIFDKLAPLLETMASTRNESWIGGRDYALEDGFYTSFDNVYIEKNEDQPMLNLPDVQWNTLKDHTVRVSERWRVRNQPITEGTLIIGSVGDGDIVKIAPNQYVYQNNLKWEPVILSNGVQGWTVTQDMTFIPIESENPVDHGEYVTKGDFQIVMDVLDTLSDEVEDHKTAIANIENNMVNKDDFLDDFNGVILTGDQLEQLKELFKVFVETTQNIYTVLQVKADE